MIRTAIPKRKKPFWYLLFISYVFFCRGACSRFLGRSISGGDICGILLSRICLTIKSLCVVQSRLSVVVAWVISLLGDGEAHLLALVSLLVIEFGKRIVQRLVIFCTVADYVGGCIDGMTESVLVSDAFTSVLKVWSKSRSIRRAEM